ncbi:ABC transporter ATP-binding protein [Plectonema cf. radiosum LEGE 06105]|uniref:ABC transporter ATP-binding protein n=1 Tax=Plectonema cf. radiosum LEGE 06105 TaxID=945769 RepID=A0A8J7FGX5_9CYAN|nr:ABC transporter ATP-binding protein [Plectonema radiosum]MBE9213596.1 ABC transporter ATP-binding protein [Plectonema cf. radiosum LEGE 06105]
MSLNVNNLTGGYSKKAIVRNINFDIARGEWLSLVGANGSGKSTLLKLISRILVPQKGRILLDGKAIHHQSAIEVAQKMALLPQQQIVPTGLTVYQLVGLGRNPHQNWWQWELDAQDRDKVESAIDAVGIEKFKNRPVERLSGGERQRAFLALALAQNPQVLLLDEPTTYLDLRYQLQLLELLKKLNLEQELTIITVLHELNLAARYSNRLAMLLNGEIWVDGDTDTVINPENIREVFGLETVVIDTPVGKQICPLRAI